MQPAGGLQCFVWYHTLRVTEGNHYSSFAHDPPAERVTPGGAKDPQPGRSRRQKGFGSAHLSPYAHGSPASSFG